MIGIKINENIVEKILKDLGFLIVNKEDVNWTIKCPSWRNDIEGKADIIEEIIRIYGF